MAKGVVKWYDESKGEGFITPTEGKMVYVSADALAASGVKTLVAGQSVTYSTVEGSGGGGLNAIDIALA